MSETSVESQVTTEAVLDPATSHIILGAVLGSLVALTVLAVIYYFCNKHKEGKKDIEQDSISLYEEGVNAKNLRATQTTALDMNGIIDWIGPQSKDNLEHSVASTPDMFDYSLHDRSAVSEALSSAIRLVSASSSVAPPVSKEVTPQGVFYSFSVEAERTELKGDSGVKEEPSDIPRNSQISDKVSMQSSPGYPRQVVTAASVYKPPKQASMTRLVLERTLSYMKRNQAEDSLTSDTYFKSSFNNLTSGQGIVEEQRDELNSSSERLKLILEKDDGEENVLGKDDFVKSEEASDSVFLNEDMPSAKETFVSDNSSSIVSPCANEEHTDDSVDSVSELLENTNVSKNNPNETSSSSFSFKALTETPEGVNSKELDWDSSHEPLETRRSVLKLVCTPNPSKSKWGKVSSSSPEDSPVKPSDVHEDSIVEGFAHEILNELEWDDEDQQGNKLPQSFSTTDKGVKMSRKSSNSSFTSAMSVGRTPLFSRLCKNSCADYATAEEDLSSNCQNISLASSEV